MTFLLDDPSPKVRLSLVEALADCPTAPRAIIKALAQDQPEIAYIAISRSPVLNDDDLVYMSANGDAEMRALIASRATVSRALAAAIAEIGGEEEVLILLENPGAGLSPGSLRRIADRLGDCVVTRGLLLKRDDLPSDVRQSLAEKVATALAASGLVRSAIGQERARRVAQEFLRRGGAGAFFGCVEGGTAAAGCPSPQRRPVDAGLAADGALQRPDGALFCGNRRPVRSPGKARSGDPFGRAVPFGQGPS